MHVAAAAALAAAISAGEGTSKKLPKVLGSPVAPDQSVLEVGSNADGQSGLMVSTHVAKCVHA